MATQTGPSCLLQFRSNGDRSNIDLVFPYHRLRIEFSVFSLLGAEPALLKLSLTRH